MRTDENPFKFGYGSPLFRKRFGDDNDEYVFKKRYMNMFKRALEKKNWQTMDDEFGNNDGGYGGWQSNGGYQQGGYQPSYQAAGAALFG